MTPHIEIGQLGSLPEWDETPLNAAFAVHRLFEHGDAVAYARSAGQYIRGLVTRGDIGVTQELIETLPALEVIVVYGVGYDAVDMETCRTRGIRVTNTPDVLSKDVADLAVAMMFAQARSIVAADHWVRSGDWKGKGGFPLQSRIYGGKAGILGLGRIGSQIARRLEPLEMDIAYSCRTPKAEAQANGWTFMAEAQALADHSDYLFVALAASTETRHIVNESVINAVGPNGMIINVSRASNMDEDALIRSLRSGALGSAALDVFEDEPAIDDRFRFLTNVLLQPHHGSGTFETRQDMGQLMRDNLTAHFSNTPLLTPVF